MSGVIKRYEFSKTKNFIGAISSLTVGIIYNTNAQLLFTPPISTNPIAYYEVFSNSILVDVIKKSGDYAYNLLELTTNVVQIKCVDVFGGKSELSNAIDITTNLFWHNYEADLIASYRLQEDYVDYKSGRNIVFSNGSFGAGMVNNSLVLNGVNSKGYIADNDVFSFTDGVNDLPFSIAFLLKYSFPKVVGSYFVNRYQAKNQYEYSVEDNGYGLFGFSLFSKGSNKNNMRKYVARPENTDTWRLITVTYDGSKTLEGMKIYFDAVEQVATSSSFAGYLGMSNTASKTNIASIGLSLDYWVTGGMADINFINKELRQVEITDIKQQFLIGNHLI